MPPKYVQRVARLPEVFAVLAAHPDGLPLADLGARFSIPPEELRADLLAFFTADLGGLLGLSRPSVLEFLGPDGRDAEPNQAEIVRIVDERPAEELGVEYVDAATLGLIYSSARALAEVDPGDQALQGALDVLAETMFGESLVPPTARTWNRPLEPLQDAARDHRKVKIVYSRAWTEGVIERVIDPYRLVQTRRGWEVDAGPPDADGALRTYLLSNLREFDVLDETFEPPTDLDERLTRQRATRTVRVRIPHSARWAADVYAEQVRVVADDELDVTLDLDLLAPVERRVGLLVLAAGPDARVVDPAGMIAAIPELAAELLAHHRRVGTGH
jgi:predicted DNA-binding transcriptional regulator YafY